MKCSLLVFLALVVAAATAKYYGICDSDGGRVTGVRVTGCKDDQETCKVNVGKKHSIKIDLESKADESNVTVDAKATDNYGWDFEYAMKRYGDRNACRGSGIRCPLKKGKSQTYQQYFSVEERGALVVIEWRFTGKNKTNVLGCVNVYVNVEK